MTNTDMELVREYAARQSEQAFQELVSRHVTLVYSSALRQVRDPHLAQEITQAVFIILAQKAGSMNPKTILPGWLYRTTRFTASKAIRQQVRRQHREQEAYMQSTIEDVPTESVWQELSPLLDETMARLGQTDRDALVLRYFENKSLQEVGMALGVEERAAQKRVARGLEKLRALLTKRGVVLSTAVIAAAISANSAQAAPAGLAMTISATVVKGAAVTASVTTFVKGTLKMMTMMKLKFAAGASIVAMLAVAGTATVAVSQGNSSGKSATEIAKKSQDAYAALSSYSDEGTVVTEGASSPTTTTFKIRMQRPNLYRVDWTQTGGFFTASGSVWSDGTGDFLLTKAAGNDAEPQKMQNLQMALGVASGVSSSASTVVPQAFFGKQGGGSMLAIASSGRAKTETARDEKVGDIDCHVITTTLDSINLPDNAGTTGKTTTKLWIGKEDYLIHKSETSLENAKLPKIVISDEGIKNALAQKNQAATPEAIAAMRKEMETTYQKTLDKLKSGKIVFTQTHENITVNQKFSPSDFAK